MKHIFVRVAMIALTLTSVFCANFATAEAGYSFWKWLNFGSDSDSTDFTVSIPNLAPTAPTLVSPSDNGYVNDSTPELSVNYSDADSGDTGTTNYRIALSAAGCSNNTSVIASGTSAATSTNSEATTWSPPSALSDGTYFWCAQNDDGVATSSWTTGTGDGWSFTLDTTSPTILAGSVLASDNSTLTLTFSSAVYTNNDATGDLVAADFTATLTSNAGGATGVSITSVNHTAGSSTAIINLSYTGSATGVETLVVTPADGASIYDVAANPMAATQTSDTETLNDITPPTIVSIDSDTADGSYPLGTTIDLIIEFSEAVTSTGLVTLTLETGTLDRICSFTVISNSTAICNYIAESGDVSSDLDVSTVSGLIKDTAGNTLTNFTPATTLATNKALVVDAKIPDIVALGAGASSADRVSLTSDTWFAYSDTGSDDQISFSWTDPTSLTDDTFYYELNADSSSTISGNESTVTTNYVDAIALTEGTRYFHVRPQNNAGTWGTERTFTVKYDKTAPTTSAAITSGTLGNASYYTTNPAVTLTPADATSGVAATVYCTDTLDSCTPVTSYASAVTLSTAGTNYIRYYSTDVAGNAQTVQSLSAKVDTAGPTGGSVTHSDSTQTSTTIAVTVSAGSDATSGLSSTNSDYLLEYRSATFADGSCGSYGDWTDAAVSETSAATNYNFTATTDNCYQFRYTVADIAGNTAIFTSANTTKVDAVAPVNPTLDLIDGYTTNNSQSIAFSATDAASGIASYTLSTQTATLSGGVCGAFGSWTSLGVQTSPYEHTSLADATCYKYQIVAADAAGNSVTYISAATTKVDTTAPTSSAAVTSGTLGESSWYTTAVEVTVTETDNDTVASTLYCTDQADSCTPTTNYSTPVAIATAGTNYFRFFSTDAAGNVQTTQSLTVKIDTSTPDAVAVDAGASSGDRTSLTSDTWFASADAGGDDQISFSWTDPTSTSDDTFYYELNASSGSTVTGVESTVTTNYVDSIAISEGTNYFHVRPKNGAGTWGTERIFIVKYDKTGPVSGSVTHLDGSQSSTTITVTVSAGSDATSGMSTTNSDYLLEYRSATLSGGTCGSYGSWTDAGVSETYNASSYDFTGTIGNCYQFRYTVADNVGNTTTFTSANTTKIEDDTPDIVAIDAGASSADRVSLTSDTWFAYSDTGSDDQISFSWTDPASASDDTFYYELNANSGNTITGDEATVTTNYVDSITISEGTNYFHVRPRAGAGTWGTERIFIIKYDKTAPTVQTTTLTSPNGGEIWTGGGASTYAITWTSGDFTDATAGLAASPITLEYSANSGSTWTSIATGEANDGSYTWTTPDLSDAEMRIRITAADAAGNTASDSSDADFRLSAHDNWIALYLIEGQKQIGGIDETLATELKVRVGNGADSSETFAPAGAVTVTFTLDSVPGTPTAVGQALANGSFGTTFGGTSTVKTVSTDANGYASVTLTLGDRAGQYVTIASFTGVETAQASRTFTSVEREIFNFTIVPANLNLNLDPSEAAASDSTTLAVTTNAASFILTANPQTWLAAGSDTIENWNGTLGFGWDNNNSGTSGGVSAITAFSGVATPTTVLTCSGGTCQGSQNFTIDFHSQVDYTYGTGSYENILEIAGASVSF